MVGRPRSLPRAAAALLLLAALLPAIALEDAQGAPWLVRGPFELPASASPLASALDFDFLGLPGGEGGARPSLIQAADEPEWLEAEGKGSGLDLGATFDSGSVAYAYREISPGLRGEARLTLRSACGLKVWIGGRLAYVRDATRDSSAEAVVVDLPGSRVPVLVKVERGGGGFGFDLRVGAVEESAFAPGREAGGTPGAGAGLRLALLEPVAAPGGALRGIVIVG